VTVLRGPSRHHVVRAIELVLVVAIVFAYLIVVTRGQVLESLGRITAPVIAASAAPTVSTLSSGDAEQ
jgi:hypothetical protein